MEYNKNLLKDIIQWDINSWSKILYYWDKNINWDNINNCLELGSREGGLSLWLALKGKNIICSDLENIENTAKPLHEKYNINKLISYENINAIDIPYENHFDLIVFKSIIGGIGREGYNNQLEVFKQIHKALKKNGKLLFAENLQGNYLHKILRTKFIKWSNSWRYISLEEIETFLKSFSSYNIKTNGVIANFGLNERQRNLLSLLDDLLLNKIFQDKNKYIVYGIAQK